MNIHWTEPAVLDLESVRDYIARDSEYYAAEFVGRILNAIENLCILPNMRRRVPEVDDPEIREIIFKSYRIIYQLDEDKGELLVLAIIHAARDMSNIKPRPWEVI